MRWINPDWFLWAGLIGITLWQKSLLPGLCGGFVAVVATQNNTSSRLKTGEKLLEELEAKFIEYAK